ncbi:hypothetical protein C427_1597 [Paraglaciecola psychrophila 170]|uniref:Cadherin domain-containing protein n=2 Tax=Paraglaciecola TaxID=1621534 RepID=K7A4Y8_9ALTE|nr:hypothetical protein C427_1597 [Paraglaciecola psychrophila 170]GAC35918.1 hypothetical protein GPSY_0276 [Paraglaciecola psychrophila 170]
MMCINCKKYILRLITLTNMFILSLGLSLSGCGENSTENTPPTVKIGDVNLFYFVTDTLDPSKRTIEAVADADDIDGSISSINWSILSHHPIELIGSDTKTIQFTAPLINSEEIDLFVLEVEATDNQGSITTDTVEIDLNDDLIIFIPLISAKRGEEIEVNALIFGRESKVSELNWSVSNGVEVTLLDANTDTVTFLAPNSSTFSTVNLELEVSFMDGSENRIFNAYVTLHD